MLTVTNAATDGDAPANLLGYSLENPPAGAVIDTNGVITWIPMEAQGPGVVTLKTIVSDGLSSATNSFTVTVEEVNVAPVLGALPDLTIIELASLTVTNAANDQDVPANGLSYQLINAPVGASISAEGVISWTPSEDQAPSTNVLETVVNDGLASATNSFTVVVTEVNTAPVLPAQPDVTVNELTTLVVTNVASDVDLPANVLIYSLVNPPAGAAIDAAGVITWTPDESQGTGTNVIITIVSDGSASATNSFVVTVLEVNLAPQLPAQSDRTIAELSTLVVTNTAMDADLPVNSMSYQLINPPAGALIDATGVINWTPTEAQGPGTNAIVTVVSDGVLSTTNVFTVVVTEVNGAPVLASISDRVIHAGCQLSVHCFASDPDGAANVLSFSLAGTPPPGLTINPTNGALSWLTTEADAGTTNSVAVEVQDNGTPSLNDSVTFSVIVVERPRIENIIVENGVATVTWNSITNHSYRLQGTENLSAPVSQDIGEDVTATGSMAQQTNSVGGVDMRFYRVRLAP